MLKLGCDPELFLRNGKEYISAHGLFPGTKENPYPVEKGAIQVDGLALEFNIEPATTEDEFNKNIETVLIQMREMVNKVDKNLKLCFHPFANFKKEYFDTLPVEAKILGCIPDYTDVGTQQVPPETLSESPFRTASGHVHLGWTEFENPNDPQHFGKCVAVASLFKHSDVFKARTVLEKARIKYYGKPGSFRPKSYGVELRQPSNRWVEHEQTRREVFRHVTNRYALALMDI